MRLSPTAIIILAGSAVIALSFGVRSVFGVVLDPLSTDLGWARETFSLSIAIQNMVWGLAQPAFGLIADRFGDRRAIWLGFFVYVAGMLLATLGFAPWMQHLGAGVLVGMGVAGTAFGLVLAVVGRAVPDEKRSMALGTTAALGALGQMVLPLVASWLTGAYGWQTALFAMTLVLLPMAAFIPLLKTPEPGPDAVPEPALPFKAMMAQAFGHSSYLLLMSGFFVCGFHVAFMTAHFPAYVTEVCGSVTLGAATLSIIGLANVMGTFVFGALGARYPKPYLLSMIYALRAVVITIFVLIPPTPITVVVFSMVIGVIWLSTVPLTSALVASMFGPKNMATLYGFVFLSHQIGSFLGVWMGGRVYDLTGSYDVMWWIAVALGVASAIVHLPVRETRVGAPVPA
ncbi:MAG: MFS transporter [Pseudomonadota bacterium]